MFLNPCCGNIKIVASTKKYPRQRCISAVPDSTKFTVKVAFSVTVVSQGKSTSVFVNFAKSLDHVKQKAK